MSERDDAAQPIDVAAKLAEGRMMFLGHELVCGRGALVPRPETELLARTAIDKLRGLQAPAVIDMCCGVGNLACAVAMAVSDARVWASDLTASSVDWAQRNVRSLGLEDRVDVRQGDLFEPLSAQGLDRTIDVVVCNPPYISSGRLAQDRAALLVNEPREAFDGGPYGLTVHQKVIRESVGYLKPGGWLLVEVGLGQARQVGALFERTNAYEPVEQYRSKSEGEVRVIAARRRQA